MEGLLEVKNKYTFGPLRSVTKRRLVLEYKSVGGKKSRKKSKKKKYISLSPLELKNIIDVRSTGRGSEQKKSRKFILRWKGEKCMTFRAPSAVEKRMWIEVLRPIVDRRNSSCDFSIPNITKISILRCIKWLQKKVVCSKGIETERIFRVIGNLKEISNISRRVFVEGNHIATTFVRMLLTVSSFKKLNNWQIDRLKVTLQNILQKKLTNEIRKKILLHDIFINIEEAINIRPQTFPLTYDIDVRIYHEDLDQVEFIVTTIMDSSYNETLSFFYSMQEEFKKNGILSLGPLVVQKYPFIYDANTSNSKTKVASVAVLVKRIFRQLPETLLTARLFKCFITAGASRDVHTITKVVHQLPETNRDILGNLIVLVNLCIHHIAMTKMTLESLAIVLGPTFLLKENEKALKTIKKTIVPLFGVLCAFGPHIFPSLSNYFPQMELLSIIPLNAQKRIWPQLEPMQAYPKRINNCLTKLPTPAFNIGQVLYQKRNNYPNTCSKRHIKKNQIFFRNQRPQNPMQDLSNRHPLRNLHQRKKNNRKNFNIERKRIIRYHRHIIPDTLVRFWPSQNVINNNQQYEWKNEQVRI